MNEKKWNGKTVLITGHSGFKGSWLSLWLQKLNANVIGYSKSIPTEPSLFQLANVDDGMISVFDDVRNYQKLKNTIEKYQPEVIFHMAAQSLVRESYKEPIETISTNIMGTANILESVRQIGKPCVVINVTSDKCYQNTNKIEAYTEEDPMGGYDPYSSSKGCSELITSAFRNSFFNISKSNQQKISVASVRAGNVIGGGDWSKDRLIPDVMKGFLKNEKIQIRNPDSIRPWQFVLEPLNGYLLLAEKLLNKEFEFASSWNFGPDENKICSVKTILDKIRTKWGLETFVEFKTSDIYEENKLILNSNKAKKNLNWQPKMNIDLAIDWIVEWYKAYHENKDIRKISENQIEKYLKL